MGDDGQPKRKRTMISLACENCRASHLKCDGNIQCSQCRKRKITCTYSKPKRRGRKPLMRDSRNEEPTSLEKPSSESFINQGTSTQMQPRPLSTGKPEFSTLMTNTNFPISNVSDMPPNEMENVMLGPGSNQLVNLNPALSSPFSQISLCNTLSNYLNVYWKYLHFIHPYFKIPKDGAMALSLISVPFDLQSHKERIYNMALNTILALGAFLLRSNQHADEFAQCATIIAKDFLFETKDYQIASGFTLLSYYYYLRMDKEKAIVLNNLATSICKNLNVLDTSPVGVGVLLARAIINSNNYVKQNQLFARLLHQRVDPSKMIVALILQTHMRIRNEVNPDFKNILLSLEHAEKELLPTLKERDKDFEFVVYKSLFLFAKAIIYWKTKIQELALQATSEGLQVLNTLSTELNFFPVWIVDFFDEILSLCIDCGSTELAEKALQCLMFLPWYHHIKMVLERVVKKYSDPVLQVSFIRNIKLAINELDQHFSQQMMHVPLDKDNHHSAPSSLGGYHLHSAVPPTSNDLKNVQDNIPPLVDPTNPTNNSVANNNPTKLDNNNFNNNNNNNSNNINNNNDNNNNANNSNTNGDGSVGIMSLKADTHSDPKRRLSIDSLNNNLNEEGSSNFRRSFHSFSNEVMNFFDPSFMNVSKTRLNTFFPDQWSGSTPTPTVPTTITPTPTASTTLNVMSSSLSQQMGITKDPNRDSLPPIPLPPLCTTPLPFYRSSTPTIDPLLMRDTLGGTPTPNLDFNTYDFLTNNQLHRPSTPNVVGGTGKSGNLEELIPNK